MRFWATGSHALSHAHVPGLLWMATMQFAGRTPCVVPWNWVVWRAAGGTAATSEPCLPSCLTRKSCSLARFHPFGKRAGSRHLTWHALEPHVGHQLGSQAPVSTRSALGPSSTESGFPEMRVAPGCRVLSCCATRCPHKNDVEALTLPGWRATGLNSSSTSLQRVGR